MSGYNEAKYEILSLIDELGEATSSDVAEITDRTIYSASRNLGHYYKQGILERYWGDGGYVYSLNERGADRLEWLEGFFWVDEEVRLAAEAARSRGRAR